MPQPLAIIERGDNWQDVFRQVFGRQEDVTSRLRGFSRFGSARCTPARSHWMTSCSSSLKLRARQKAD